MPAFTQSHLGVCVTDMERSLRFYRDGLGCAVGPRYEIDTPISETSGDVRLVSQFVHNGDMRIELLAFASPKPIGTPSSKRYQLGLTHLSFVVDDIDTAAAHLVAHGGTIVEGTRSVQEGKVHIIFIADPDGTRIELMVMPAGHRWPWY